MLNNIIIIMMLFVFSCYIGAGAYLIRGMEELGDPLINSLVLGIVGEVWGLCVLCQIFHIAE